MSSLLDTNILIYHLNGVPSATALVEGLFDAGVAISVISYVEVVEGIARSADPELALASFQALLEHIPVIDFGRLEAEELIQVR